MSTDTPSKPSRLCPTCGTRVTEDASRCLVCGSDLSGSDPTSRSTKSVQGSRMPMLTLSLPAVMGLLTLFLAIGAGMVYLALRDTGLIVEPTITSTATLTETPTITPTPLTPTPTETPEPSPTPWTHVIAEGNSCTGIAARYGVSVASIAQLNNLPPDCGVLIVGSELLIPQPTATNTPFPTATLSDLDATEQACERASYTVREGDSLSSIATAYNVPMAVIRDYNGLPSDTVFLGQLLTIPLCLQNPTPGPTPTATPRPPYSAPNLLLPPDGHNFSGIEETISLQWASVGALAENEAYSVTVEMVTGGEFLRHTDYVTDTKFIVPRSIQPPNSSAHLYYWWVTTVRRIGIDDDGSPIWASAGAASEKRGFIWSGASR
ncbi:MAG: LysM peptidoglycan-binding domain-containing protein [Anaerolineales bacterium]|nr:LysM peptidoglycan-binding domain-containing protein [Anaerolineales bacterium]